MTSKSRNRSKRSKRFCDVISRSSSNPEEKNLSSSDSDSEVTCKKRKVRVGFSTKMLMNEGQIYKVGNDHIYTRRMSNDTVYESTRKKRSSEESDEKTIKQKCFSKNAVLARLNRERKKRYVTSLENENELLRNQNEDMNKKIEKQNQLMFAMKREICYLKGLLANSKELGQILKSLKDTTDLPITSSMIFTTTSEKGNESIEKSFIIEHDEKDLMEYQPRVKHVNSGNGFPILSEDVNLQNCLDKSFDDNIDLQYCPLDFETELTQNSLDTSSYNNEDAFINFYNDDFNLGFNDSFNFEDSSKNNPNVGICLHVNKKSISVEICSICNSKAESFKKSPNKVD